jgi:hypothetical protein
MYQPTPPDPCRRRTADNRAAMSDIASSQVTGSNPFGPSSSPGRSAPARRRRNGVVTRSGSFCTSVKAMPFWHANPADSGCSLSGRSATRRPSSTVATIPHSGSQIRQNVGLFSITGATLTTIL